MIASGALLALSRTTYQGKSEYQIMAPIYSDIRSYTGYIDIQARHIFFYFFESRSDPDKDDVVFWTNGGELWTESASSLVPFQLCIMNIWEPRSLLIHPEVHRRIGLILNTNISRPGMLILHRPFYGTWWVACALCFNRTITITTLYIGPCRITTPDGPAPNNFSWNSKSNIFFVDQPIGVGFSYAEYGESVVSTDFIFIVRRVIDCLGLLFRAQQKRRQKI